MGVRLRPAVSIALALGIMLLAAGVMADTHSGEGTRGPLLIGLTPEQNVFKQMERYAPLAEYLSKKTGLDVKLKVSVSYGKLIGDFASSGMDGAFFGSLAYVLAHERIGVGALVRPEARNGSSLYHGIVFVRKDSGIRNVSDMRGKRFAFVDPVTTAGFLLPLVYLRSHGIKDYEGYFGETYFAGTHEDAIYDVLNGKADIGAAKNTVFWRLAGTDQRIRRELKILTRSPDMPEGTLAVRKDLDPRVSAAIRDSLLQMHNDPEGRTILKDFGALRFVRTTDADFEPVVGYLRQIGSSPKHYRYPAE